MIIEKLFRKHRSIGVVGNIHTAKSSLILKELVELRENIDIDVYVLGAEYNLEPYLMSKGIKILQSSDDILDLKIRGAVLYIDEFADIFDVKMASKQTEKIRRFFNRLAHLNNYVIISTAQTKFWNVFMCSLVKAYIVKEIEYDSLVNGTFLKRKIQNITSNTSDYRLDAAKEEYYVITDENLVEKGTFEYNKDLDSKKSLVNPFLDKKVEENLDNNLELEAEK